MHAEDDAGGEGGQRHAEERAWIASIASGGIAGNAAMKSLSQRYQRRFRAHLRSRWFADADVEDITQRVWLDVARKAHTFDGAGVPESWLWKFLKNVMLDAVRRFAQQSSRFTSANDDESTEPVDDAALQAAPEALRSLRDLRECVDRAFSAFKRRHRHAAWWLYLTYVEGWDLGQVAEYRGSSRHATVQFLSSARRLFQPYLAPCLELRAS